MKFIKRIFSVACLGAIALSCVDDSTLPYDQGEIIGNQGAFIRTTDVGSSIIDYFDFDNSYMEVSLEEWDVEDGALMQNVELTLEFMDNTADNGSNSIEAIKIKTFVPADWSKSADTGLPNLTFTYTAPELLNLLDLTFADVQGGDVFRFEWTLNLTNGKSFNRNNQSNSLSSWPFYNAPFLQDVPIVCLFASDDFYTGDYNITMTTTSGFGVAFEDQVVTLVEGDSPTKRSFDAVYLPSAGIGQDPMTFVWDMVCGTVIPDAGQSSGLGCTDSILFGPSSTPSNYDNDSDATLVINAIEAEDPGACGLTDQEVVIVLTKI